MLFSQFDQIRVINLARRADRRREMTAELERVGVEIDGTRVAFFEARLASDTGGFYSIGAHGCYLSHLEVLEQATGSLLILEDDCDFTRAIADYRMPPCDFFYGGVERASNPDDLHSSDIVGAHFMGFSAQVVPKLARYLRRIYEDSDFRGNVAPPPIDGAYVWYRRAHPQTTTIFADPPLGKQRPSRTDIGTASPIDKFPVAARLARYLRRRIKRLADF